MHGWVSLEDTSCTTAIKCSRQCVQAREDAQQARLDDIRNQSATIQRYTPSGFEKRKAPAALYHSLHAYFEVQQLLSSYL